MMSAVKDECDDVLSKRTKITTKNLTRRILKRKLSNNGPKITRYPYTWYYAKLKVVSACKLKNLRIQMKTNDLRIQRKTNEQSLSKGLSKPKNQLAMSRNNESANELQRTATHRYYRTYSTHHRLSRTSNSLLFCSLRKERQRG